MRRPADVSDLSGLTDLSEDAICEVLRQRYAADRIYTLVGDILIFLNPFKTVGVYTDKEFSRFSCPTGRGCDEAESMAHIYAVGSAAFRLRERNAAILISGESGSGKTESTKLLLQQFVRLAGGSKMHSAKVAESLLAANPLMEAFGNARTVMNHNSSRFAKFVTVGLHDGAMVSSEIRAYMLEKSRLVSASEDEGNFHIFYYTCLSSNPFVKDLLSSVGEKSFRLLSNLERLGRQYDNIEGRMTEVLACFDTLGFSHQQKTAVFHILAGLLLLGNVTFVTHEHEHSVRTVIDPGSEETFKVACKTLGLKGKDARRRLLKTLTSAKIQVNEEDIYSMFQEDKTRVVLNGSIKAVYAKLFDWIVKKINEHVASVGCATKQAKTRDLGVLDIFGFECLARNSFEQLCINLANEQLQLFFTHHVIQLEQLEYQVEGMPWVDIPFEDNREALSIFLERPLGLLSLLNEESSLATGTDEGLYRKLLAHMQRRPKLEISDRNPAVFAVSHYAGTVTYTLPGLVDRNRDRAPQATLDVLASSKLKLLGELFTAPKSKTQKPSGEHLAVQFRHSLEFLLQRLQEAQPFFVRCIKPNRQNAADSFTDEYVARQIHYCGIAEAVRVRRAGYPVRYLYGEFRATFPILYKMHGTGFHSSEAARLSAIFTRLGLSQSEFAMGKTKVFLKTDAGRQLALLDEQLRRRIVAAQSAVRGFLQRRRFTRYKAERMERRRQAEQERREQEMQQQAGASTITSSSSLACSSEGDENRTDEGVQVSRSDTVRWFRNNHLQMLNEHCKEYQQWFHGIITRQETNALLQYEQKGAFLIRVSNTRLGFVLSFKGADVVKHYLIEQLKKGRFNIIGEKKVHKNLNDMIEHHRQHGFRNCDILLTRGVGQTHLQEPDYDELLA